MVDEGFYEEPEYASEGGSMGETFGKLGSAGGAIFLLYQLIGFFTTCYERMSFRNRLLKRLYFARANDGEELFP